MFLGALARAGIPAPAPASRRGGRKKRAKEEQEQGQEQQEAEGTLWPAVLSTCLPGLMGQAMGEMLSGGGGGGRKVSQPGVDRLMHRDTDAHTPHTTHTAVSRQPAQSIDASGH